MCPGASIGVGVGQVTVFLASIFKNCFYNHNSSVKAVRIIAFFCFFNLKNVKRFSARCL